MDPPFLTALGFLVGRPLLFRNRGTAVFFFWRTMRPQLPMDRVEVEKSASMGSSPVGKVKAMGFVPTRASVPP
jgi:hypothetical protein